MRPMPHFEAGLWLYPGDTGSCFVALPLDLSDDLREQTEGQRPSFGSARVTMTVG